ncbi:MAG TPA: ferritin-like domain-containing protein, partial [Polyangiaceae bacterium]|nr:ferritin-like domain-containing protein [Polyangiaceae bacterium]
MTAPSLPPPSREQLLHQLYEAAELEHCLMCTYLYAAFSLKSGTEEGLRADEVDAVERWRREILRIAIEEMGHLTAVWNITSALGGSPRFGRGNFPLDAGMLPAGMVVKLAPFCEAVLQHFVHLERPENSSEADGAGFAPAATFRRGVAAARLTPMPLDYETVGSFYATLDESLRTFSAQVGEKVAFCGDPALQLSAHEVDLVGAQPVICLKTARAAFSSIVEQGEGAPQHSIDSHFQRFTSMRRELTELQSRNPSFVPAWPAAENPVLRPPQRRESRVWLENEEAAATVDLANAAYGLMLRLLAYTYLLPRPAPEKSLSVKLALGLMRAATLLAERAVRLPAGPAHPGVNAGMSFTNLRDAAPLPPGASAQRFFRERFAELSQGAQLLLPSGDARVQRAARLFEEFARQANLGFQNTIGSITTHPRETASAPPLSAASPADASPSIAAAPAPATSPPTPTVIDGVEHIEGKHLTLLYEGKRCIHARFCVTWGPNVFLANVQGPWINPDAMSVDSLVEIAHVCPSGAIRYRRKDGKAEEAAPPVNLLAVREGGPYAVRADLRLNGQSGSYRATLCRCGASKNKPFCDGSHHE